MEIRNSLSARLCEFWVSILDPLCGLSELRGKKINF